MNIDFNETIPCDQCKRLNNPETLMDLYAVVISKRLSKSENCRMHGYDYFTSIWKDSPINPAKMFVCCRCGLKRAVAIIVQ